MLFSDTASALALLQDHQADFLDPIQGVYLHAQVLYYAIKNTNSEIIRYLLNLPVLSDIVFFKFCGHTPISLAVEEDRNELIPLLLTKTDKNFALHMAVKLNLFKTKNLLLKKCVFKQKLLRFLGLQ
jgi:hypothetical protein